MPKKQRSVIHTVCGVHTTDGAGVRLVRVLDNTTTDAYDPILLLDSFDSTDPADYTAGFPMHPHRGIETISYVYKGAMRHKDSLGSADTVSDGGVQWMTAGSGILHEEQLPPTKRMLGVQLWLNLPQKDKMAPPSYHAITAEKIEEIPFAGGFLRLLAGSYLQHQGFQGRYLPLDYYDIHINGNAAFTVDTKTDASVMIFTLTGSITVGAETLPEKTAAKLSPGDAVTLTAGHQGAQVLFMSSRRLDEAVTWGGSIVMNTPEELQECFRELRLGTFLKNTLSYEK
ncbi:pirin family protein [Megasphaera vaginalis (ex Srinivasan et al. 2021)]|uniref:Pirin family protein n=1 Tax=Megasphaera vaginalis (ex Srinivasan et al. 2021) TaxID=1111454 RepID=U7UIW9_9FIRM|nr:pirin family protein [Megasphaera vaginalis (ex Srinivasan et al. 2021)]ERT59236.1 pirin family protein [Megasphaera vaginalis (ex Srinivasan et al. 2021)]